MNFFENPNNTPLLYSFVLLALAGLLYYAKHTALSFACMLFAIVFYARQTGKLEFFSVQDNTIDLRYPKTINTVRSYVPYNLSPYLEVPFKNTHVTGVDAGANRQQSLNAKYPTPFTPNIFAKNVAKPEYCAQGNAMFSTDQGCIKPSPEQIKLLSSRGYNADLTHIY